MPPQPVPTEAPSLSLPTGMPALDSRDRSRVRERSAEVTLGTCKCPWSPGHPPGLDAPHLRVTEHFSGSICEEGWCVQQGHGLHVFTAQFVPGVPAQSSPSQGYLRLGHPLGGHRLSRQVPSGPSSSLAPPGHPCPVTGHPSWGAWGGPALRVTVRARQACPRAFTASSQPLPLRPTAAPGQGRGSSVPRATVWDTDSRWPRLWLLEASFVVVVSQNVASTMLFKVCFFKKR